MPLSGSTTYTQLSGVNNLIRSLLNDVNGAVFTDAILLPYVNSTYRIIQKKISNAGGDEFITDGVLFVIPAVAANQQDPGTQVVLNDAGFTYLNVFTQLPTNLIEPLKIWERPNLSTQDFEEMVNLTSHGGLPSRPQGQTLREWEWRTDGVYFVGATQDTQIRMRYTSFLPDLINAQDMILIRGAQECLAQGAAGLAAGARGSPMAEQMDNLFNDSVEDVIVGNVRSQQNSPVRRKPYSSRSYGSRGRRYF